MLWNDSETGSENPGELERNSRSDLGVRWLREFERKREEGCCVSWEGFGLKKRQNKKEIGGCKSLIWWQEFFLFFLFFYVWIKRNGFLFYKCLSGSSSWSFYKFFYVYLLIKKIINKMYFPQKKIDLVLFRQKYFLKVVKKNIL